MRITLIELDRNRALRYVQSALSDGRTLSACLLREAPIERAHFHTWLPEGVPEEKRYDFHMGGKVPYKEEPIYLPSGGALIPTGNTDEEVVQYICTYLGLRDDLAFVIEHPFAQPSDPWIERYVPPRGTGLIFWDDEVYLYGDREADSEGIGAILRQGSSIWPPTIAVLTRADGLAHNLWSPDLVAHYTSVLIVGAYDGESFILAEW